MALIKDVDLQEIKTIVETNTGDRLEVTILPIITLKDSVIDALEGNKLSKKWSDFEKSYGSDNNKGYQVIEDVDLPEDDVFYDDKYKHVYFITLESFSKLNEKQRSELNIGLRVVGFDEKVAYSLDEDLSVLFGLTDISELVEPDVLDSNLSIDDIEDTYGTLIYELRERSVKNYERMKKEELDKIEAQKKREKEEAERKKKEEEEAERKRKEEAYKKENLPREPKPDPEDLEDLKSRIRDIVEKSIPQVEIPKTDEDRFSVISNDKDYDEIKKLTRNQIEDVESDYYNYLVAERSKLVESVYNRMVESAIRRHYENDNIFNYKTADSELYEDFNEIRSMYEGSMRTIPQRKEEIHSKHLREFNQGLEDYIEEAKRKAEKEYTDKHRDSVDAKTNEDIENIKNEISDIYNHAVRNLEDSLLETRNKRFKNIPHEVFDEHSDILDEKSNTFVSDLKNNIDELSNKRRNIITDMNRAIKELEFKRIGNENLFKDKVDNEVKRRTLELEKESSNVVDMENKIKSLEDNINHRDEEIKSLRDNSSKLSTSLSNIKSSQSDEPTGNIFTNNKLATGLLSLLLLTGAGATGYGVYDLMNDDDEALNTIQEKLDENSKASQELKDAYGDLKETYEESNSNNEQNNEQNDEKSSNLPPKSELEVGDEVPVKLSDGSIELAEVLSNDGEKVIVRTSQGEKQL